MTSTQRLDRRPPGPSTVINAIPRTNQTDPAKFPPYVYQPYPRMIKNKKDNSPYIDQEFNAIAIVYDEDEEREFLANHPDACVTKAGVSLAADLKESQDKTEKQAKEIEDLKAQVAALIAMNTPKANPVPSGLSVPVQQPMVARKKPGPKPKQKTAQMTSEPSLEQKLAAATAELEALKKQAAAAASNGLPANLD